MVASTDVGALCERALELAETEWLREDAADQDALVAEAARVEKLLLREVTR